MMTMDSSYLGMMLEPNLLPSIARESFWKLKRHKGLYVYFDDVEDIIMDSCVRIIKHIEKGNYVNKTWYGKTYKTVSNTVRKYRIYRQREVTTGDT